MATKIRLARGGTKKRPFYRIVIADERAPRETVTLLRKLETLIQCYLKITKRD